MHTDLPQRWFNILIYGLIVVVSSELIYKTSSLIFTNGVHIEILLPAFVFGMVMFKSHNENKSDVRASSMISYLFMFLVGLTMPVFVGNMDYTLGSGHSTHLVMNWGQIAFHVVIVTILSNVGKLYPLLHYRDRSFRERLAISFGMFTRGEVGAGIIFIAIGYNIGGPLLAISVLTLVLNLVLTGFFIVVVRKLAMSTSRFEGAQINDNH